MGGSKAKRGQSGDGPSFEADGLIPISALAAVNRRFCPLAGNHREDLSSTLSDEDSTTRWLLCPGSHFLLCTTEAQHFRSLATLEPLQQNLPAVPETYGVTMDIRLGA